MTTAAPGIFYKNCDRVGRVPHHSYKEYMFPCAAVANGEGTVRMFAVSLLTRVDSILGFRLCLLLGVAPPRVVCSSRNACAAFITIACGRTVQCLCFQFPSFTRGDSMFGFRSCSLLGVAGPRVVCFSRNACAAFITLACGSTATSPC